MFNPPVYYWQEPDFILYRKNIEQLKIDWLEHDDGTDYIYTFHLKRQYSKPDCFIIAGFSGDSYNAEFRVFFEVWDDHTTNPKQLTLF